MNHTRAFIATTALTLLSGAAFGAQTNTYPDCIASQDELAMQEIARTMVHSLTADEQRIIAANGALGSDALDLSGFTTDSATRADMPKLAQGTSAIEYLDMLLSDELRAELSEQQLALATNIANLIDAGTRMPALCFAPDADPKYAAMINTLLDYHFVSGNDDDNSRFQQGSRWSQTATDGGGLSQGDATTITYSFVPDNTFVPNTGLGQGSSRLFQWLNGRYGNAATWQPLFHQVFDRWEELTGLSYVYESNDDGSTLGSLPGIIGVRGDVRIAAFNFPLDGNNGVLGYNSFPNNGDMALDAFDSYYNSTANNSIRLRNVVAHEHGHGLGMAHVCPNEGTKLMEPFANNSFDGPQLDDILNGQRHYGDPNEPNNNFSDATDLGTYGDNGFLGLDNVSIDDNSDTDYYLVELTERARITFTVSPDADEYLNGSQRANGSCSSGTLANFDTIQDLKIDIYQFPNFVTPVASIDDTAKGGSETIAYDAESAGVYYIKISPVTTVNNVQLYRSLLFLAALPPVQCPADMNDDGVLNFFDVGDFLTAYAAEEPAADFTGDGEFNFFDVGDFLAAYAAGCP